MFWIPWCHTHSDVKFQILIANQMTVFVNRNMRFSHSIWNRSLARIRVPSTSFNSSGLTGFILRLSTLELWSFILLFVYRMRSSKVLILNMHHMIWVIMFIFCLNKYNKPFLVELNCRWIHVGDKDHLAFLVLFRNVYIRPRVKLCLDQIFGLENSAYFRNDSICRYYSRGIPFLCLIINF